LDITRILTDYFKKKMPQVQDIAIQGLERASGGWSDEAYLFSLQWEENGSVRQQGMVIRKSGKSGLDLLKQEGTLKRQFEILQKLNRTGIPVPRVYWLEEDETILGAPFFLMDKIEGKTYVPWSREGRAFFREASQRGTLPRQFVEYLAMIHQLDIHALGLDFLPVPGPGTAYITTKLDEMREILKRNQINRDPVMTETFAWLMRHRPPARRICLMHGDYRTGNLIYDGDRIAGILDWEAAEIGDPVSDVAYVCSKFNRMDSPLLCYLVERDWFLDAYEQLTGLSIDRKALHYYEVFHQLRGAMISLSAKISIQNGTTGDLRLVRQAYRLPLLKHMIAETIGY
jgi:aminoglycoside phosphotransferase (APT) family kinase protein